MPTSGEQRPDDAPLQETKLIRLKGGFLVEADLSADRVRHVAGSDAPIKQKSLDEIQPLLKAVCRPLIDTWNELNKEMVIEQAEVELGLNFEGEGNLYIARAKTAANFKVKLVLKPPAPQKPTGADDEQEKPANVASTAPGQTSTP